MAIFSLIAKMCPEPTKPDPSIGSDIEVLLLNSIDTSADEDSDTGTNSLNASIITFPSDDLREEDDTLDIDDQDIDDDLPIQSTVIINYLPMHITLLLLLRILFYSD